MAPAAAAMPSTNAAPMTPQRTTPACGPVAVCAKAEPATITSTSATKTHTQREDAGEVTDHFDGEHERGQPPDGAHEVLEVVDRSLGPEALHVVVEERADGQAEGRVGVAGRRLQEEEQPEHVREEDEAGEAADDVEVFRRGAVPDDVVDEVLQRGDRHLEDVLERSRVVTADAARSQRA